MTRPPEIPALAAPPLSSAGWSQHPSGLAIPDTHGPSSAASLAGREAAVTRREDAVAQREKDAARREAALDARERKREPTGRGLVIAQVLIELFAAIGPWIGPIGSLGIEHAFLLDYRGVARVGMKPSPWAGASTTRSRMSGVLVRAWTLARMLGHAQTASPGATSRPATSQPFRGGAAAHCARAGQRAGRARALTGNVLFAED